MLTIFVLPYQQDGSEKKHTSPKAKDQRRVNVCRPDADLPADKATEKDPQGAVSSVGQES